MKRDCPIIKAQGRENSEAQGSAPNPNDPTKNRLYALRSTGDQDESPDVFTSLLQVLSINFYYLLDRHSKLEFVTPLLARYFNVLPDVLMEHFF